MNTFCVRKSSTALLRESFVIEAHTASIRGEAQISSISSSTGAKSELLGADISHFIFVCLIFVRLSIIKSLIWVRQKRYPTLSRIIISPIRLRSMPRFNIAPRKSRCESSSANLRIRGDIFIHTIGKGSS